MPYIETPTDLQAMQNYQSSCLEILDGPNSVLNEESLEAVLGVGTVTVMTFAILCSMMVCKRILVQSKFSIVGLIHRFISHEPSLA